ncbi:MAG: hypothetical protein K8J31_18610 [Anaerolineae bacterium]|jgi:hypothetical protein|nr:hypothetical protein [Anaerolineae bacterium]
MINQSDIEGRLRLFRYGLVVLVVVTFLVSLLAPYTATRELGTAITDFLGSAVLYSIIVAALSVAIYFGYSTLLKRTAGSKGS